ncbi:MAG: Pr6Pr family membrane protein [Phyllobacteriaceae bacterium]|nr:Pr6Pr family membrane protein [Phyllobacteriaceae bacterium]
MSSHSFGSRARSAAAIIALVAALTLGLRVVLSVAETGSIAGALAHLSQFFTILTNTLVLVMISAVALGARVGPRPAQALTIAIVGVGIIYHVALAHLVDFSGLSLLADHGVHTVVPALTLVWWFAFAPKEMPGPGAIAVWIAWPLVYCVYILIRAQGSGFYPYPFLNLPEIGVQGLAVSVLVISIAFVVIGFAMTAAASALRRIFAARTDQPGRS